MVRRCTASHRYPEQTAIALGCHSTPYQGCKAQWQRPVGACGWGPRGQWERGWWSPQATGRGWQGLNPLARPHTGCNTPRSIGPGLSHITHARSGGYVMRTNPQGTLAAKYALFPAVFTPYAISHVRRRTLICAHRTAGATVLWYCRCCRRRRHRFHRCAATARPLRCHC